MMSTNNIRTINNGLVYLKIISLFCLYLKEQIDHKQVFNEIGIKDKSLIFSLLSKWITLNLVDFEPRRV